MIFYLRNDTIGAEKRKIVEIFFSDSKAKKHFW